MLPRVAGAAHDLRLAPHAFRAGSNSRRGGGTPSAMASRDR